MTSDTSASSKDPTALSYASSSAPRLEHSPGRLLLVAEPFISRRHLVIKAVVTAMVVGLRNHLKSSVVP